MTTETKIIGVEELRWQYFMLDKCMWISMIDLCKNSNDLHRRINSEHFRGGLHELKQSPVNFADCAHWRIGYGKDFDISKSSISLASTLDSILSGTATEDNEYIWNRIVLDGYGLGSKLMLATILELESINPGVLNRIIFFSSDGEFFPEKGINKLDLISKIQQKFSKKSKALKEDVQIPKSPLLLGDVKLFLSKDNKNNTKTIELFSKIFEKFTVVEQ